MEPPDNGTGETPRAPDSGHAAGIPRTPRDDEAGGVAPRTQEDAYTAPQTAKVLGLSDRRVRQMLEAGELEGSRDRSGKWWVPQRAVHEALSDRGSPRGAPRRASSGPAGEDDTDDEPLSSPRRPPGSPESLRDLASRVARGP